MQAHRTADEAIKRALVSGALTKVLTIALTMATLGLAARSLEPKLFGVVSIIVAAAAFFSFLDFGLGSAAINPLASAVASDEHAQVRTLLSSLFAATTFLAGTFGGILAVSSLYLAGPLALHLGVSRTTVLSSCLTLSVIVSLGLVGAQGPKLASAMQRSEWNAAALLASAALSTAMAGAGLLASAPPAWFLASIIGPQVGINIGLICILVRSLNPTARPRAGGGTRACLFDLIVRGPAYFILVLVGAISFQSGPLIIGALLPTEQVGVFAVTARMFSVVSSVYAIGLQQVWGSLASQFAAGDLSAASEITCRWGRFVVLSATVMSAAIFLLGRPLVRLWAGPALVPSFTLLAVFAAWSVYVVFMTFLGSVLSAAGRVGAQAAAAVAMALISVPFGIVLTHVFGSYGVILATMSTHMLIVAPVTIHALRNCFEGRSSSGHGPLKSDRTDVAISRAEEGP